MSLTIPKFDFQIICADCGASRTAELCGVCELLKMNGAGGEGISITSPPRPVIVVKALYAGGNKVDGSKCGYVAIVLLDNLLIHTTDVYPPASAELCPGNYGFLAHSAARQWLRSALPHASVESD